MVGNDLVFEERHVVCGVDESFDRVGADSVEGVGGVRRSAREGAAAERPIDRLHDSARWRARLHHRERRLRCFHLSSPELDYIVGWRAEGITAPELEPVAG